MSPWDLGNGITWFGFGLSGVLLLIAFVIWASGTEGAGWFVAGAFVCLFLFAIGGLLVYQIMQFGFVDGVAGVVIGIVILIFLLKFIGWLSS